MEQVFLAHVFVKQLSNVYLQSWTFFVLSGLFKHAHQLLQVLLSDRQNKIRVWATLISLYINDLPVKHGFSAPLEILEEVYKIARHFETAFPEYRYLADLSAVLELRFFNLQGSCVSDLHDELVRIVFDNLLLKLLQLHLMKFLADSIDCLVKSNGHFIGGVNLNDQFLKKTTCQFFFAFASDLKDFNQRNQIEHIDPLLHMQVELSQVDIDNQSALCNFFL